MAVTRRALRKFYRSREWARASAQARLLAGNRCRNDAAHEGRTEVDHIIPVREWWDGRLRLSNLQVLCVRCHRAKHMAGRKDKA